MEHLGEVNKRESNVMCNMTKVMMLITFLNKATVKNVIIVYRKNKTPCVLGRFSFTVLSLMIVKFPIKDKTQLKISVNSLTFL